MDGSSVAISKKSLPFTTTLRPLNSTSTSCPSISGVSSLPLVIAFTAFHFPSNFLSSFWAASESLGSSAAASDKRQGQQCGDHAILRSGNVTEHPSDARRLQPFHPAGTVTRAPARNTHAPPPHARPRRPAADRVPRAQAAASARQLRRGAGRLRGAAQGQEPRRRGIRWPRALLASRGRYSDALDALDAGLKAHPDDPTLLAHRADLFFFLGKWDDAAKDAEAAIKKQDANFLARWVRVRFLRDKGDIPAADKEVRWFVKTYSDASAAGKDITDPELLLLIGLAGAENARWNNKPAQFEFILNEVYKDALKADADCWQAEIQAGYLLLEKHNRADAADAFDKALKINPKAVEALVGKGHARAGGTRLRGRGPARRSGARR